MVVTKKGYLITLSSILLVLIPFLLSCNTGSNVSKSSASSKSSGLYEADPAIAKPGIQNCYGHVFWQLTGITGNFKTFAEVENEMKRRGYKEYTMAMSDPIKAGDVVRMTGPKTDHIGISLYDGTLCHFRETGTQTVLQEDGGLFPSSNLLIISPEKLVTYPQDYIDWLKKKGASEAAIQKKIKELSIGFWHQRDTMAEIKHLFYPDDNVTLDLTIWRLPSKLEITQDKQTIQSGETVKCEAWLVFGPGLEKVKADSYTEVFWGDPPQQFESGTISASELHDGENIIKASVTIISPWALASDAIKKEYIGKDVLLNLEAETTVTVGNTPGFPALSFTGPVEPNAGELKLKIDTSGKVTGTWQGDVYQGTDRTTYDGSFSGTLESPSYMGFRDVQGTITIKEFQRDGSVKTKTGKMFLWGGEVQADLSTGVLTGYSSHAIIRVDMDGDGKWDNDIYDWKAEAPIVQ